MENLAFIWFFAEFIFKETGKYGQWERRRQESRMVRANEFRWSLQQESKFFFMVDFG